MSYVLTEGRGRKPLITDRAAFLLAISRAWVWEEFREAVCGVLRSRFEEVPRYILQVDVVDPTQSARAPRSGIKVPDTGPEPPDYSIEIVTTSVLNPELYEILNDAIRWGCDWAEDAEQELSAAARKLFATRDR